MLLDTYQELMTLPIKAFNGLNDPEELQRYECSTIWKQSSRDNLTKYLLQAQDMREKELGYYLTPTYTVEELHNTVNNPHMLWNKHLIALGKKVIEEISYDEPVPGILHITNTDDPITITVATTVTDTTEVHVYKKDANLTQYEVTPSYINIASGVLTLKIPRARLVDPDLLDDRDDHLDYYDDTNYVTVVDIQREYADASQAITYYWHTCETFAMSTYAGYGEITDNRLSMINAYPATWSGAVATPSYLCADYIKHMKISYLSGKRKDSKLDLQTIRLAHTLMPYEPCTCEPVHQYWLADVMRDPSNIITPYGSSVAALFVWMADSRSKIGYGTTVGGKS